MAIYNTPDGRQVVGSTVAGNDYHGFNGKRDIIIQLTADGATTDGLNALEYLKAYAVEQNKQNKPIFPNGTRVFISANGYTKAVEADDIVIDGDNITIGGIAWNGEAWDFTNAGQTGGGASLPEITDADDGKVLTADSGVWGASIRRSVDITNDLVQVIEATVDGSLHFSTDVTPNDIINGYTAGTKVNPKFEQSVSTMLRVSAAGLNCVLHPTSVGDYGISFMSDIYDGALVGMSSIWFQIDVTAVQSDQAYNVYMRQFDKN